MAELELNVVLMPDNGVRDVAIDISRKLSENFQTNFVLNATNKLPHITIYQAGFPGKNLDQISAYLKTVASRMSPFEVILGKFSRWNNYIFWDMEVTNEFMHLNKSVVYQLNSLREGVILKYLQGGKWNMSETYSIQNYGNLLPGKDYTPHITICSLKDDREAERALQETRPKIAKFIATKMFLGPRGQHGTFTEIMEEFPFGGQSPYMLRSQNYF